MFFICFLYAWVVPLKYNKGITIIDCFQKSLDESGCKTSKIWVDKGRDIYSKSWISCLHNDNNTEMYSRYNEEKYFVSKAFFWTLKSNIYKYITLISKNVYLVQLRHNLKDTAIHIVEAADVKSKTYINFNKENNYKDSKFKVGDYVRISKYESIFTEGFVPNWSGDVEKRVSIETNKKESRIENVIKRKGNKLYVKWKGYNNYVNRRIDQSDIII